MSKTYLKIKISSLAAEATIIRREEKKWPKTHPIHVGLKAHRRWDVRREARVALLAYGFIRGRSYHALEAKCYEDPDWSRVAKLAARYGAGSGRPQITLADIMEWAKPTALKVAA